MMRRLLLLAWPLFGAAACGTDAVGVDDCRAIESVRCEEAAACGRVDDVAACQRYYRGHCLHGLPVRNRPARDDRDQCVQAIREAGACARNQGAETPLATCQGGPPTLALPEKSFTTVCDVVLRPWDGQACEFLNPVAPGSNMGEGGANGTGDP